MKKILILLFTCNVMLSQTYNNNFLDGTVIFKFKEFIEIKNENIIKSPDNIGLIVDLKDYPLLREVSFIGLIFIRSNV